MKNSNHWSGESYILAIHHPLGSNGNHGGQYAFNQYRLTIFNIPINVIRKTSGVAPSVLNYPFYREL